jgi:predicted RND superfamily exporter protein
VTTGPARPALWICLAIVVAVGVLQGLLALRVDNSPQRFFARDDESLAAEAEFRGFFGGERRLLLVVTDPDLWTESGLENVAAVEKVAGESAGVIRTSGVWSRHRWLETAWPPPDLAGFVRRARLDPLVRAAGWVGTSDDVVTISVELDRESGPDEVSSLEAAVQAVAPAGMRISLTGLPVIERAMEQGIRRLLAVHFPLLLVMVTLLLWIGFRSFAETVAALGFVAVVEVTTLGVLGLTGATLDMISVVFLPLLLVVSLATAVHLQAGFRRELEEGRSPREACRRTMRRKGRAVILTGLTTAFAFGSFTTSSLQSLRSLGLWLAGGLLWMILVACGLYPALMRMTARFTAGRAPSLERSVRLRSRDLGRTVASRRRHLLVAFTVMALLAVAGMSRLDLENNLLSYLGVDDPARRAAELLQSRGLGSGTAELLVRLPEETPADRRFRDPSGLDRLAGLAASLRELQGVRGAVGAGDLFRAAVDDVVVSDNPSPGARWLVLGLMQADPDVAARLDRFLADQGRAARITLMLPLLGPEQLDPVLTSAVGLAEEAFPGASVRVAGELPLILASQRRLLETMTGSFASTLGLIGLVFLIVTRSLSKTLRFLTPNIWAVLAVFGTMGWLGVPLDSTTVMIAAVALGLAVDDTIHTMAELEPGDRRISAHRLSEVLRRVAPAHTLTSLVLASGFAAVALSEFVPVARFGALAIVGIVAALGGDLLLLPALLVQRSGRDAAGDGAG